MKSLEGTVATKSSELTSANERYAYIYTVHGSQIKVPVWFP